MATSKPRITISLEPQAYEVISRLAAANRKPMSSVVTDFLDLARPQMERMVAILEAARSAPDQARASIRKSLDRAESVLLPVLLEAIEQQDLFLAAEAGLDPSDVAWYQPGQAGAERGEKRGARRPAEALTPRPVTRGVGTPQKAKSKANKGGSNA